MKTQGFIVVFRQQDERHAGALDTKPSDVLPRSLSPRSEPVVRREEKTDIERSSVSKGFQGSCTWQDVQKTSLKST
jgi:hypothetical protein